jgi:hypothetical protein
MRAFVIMPFAEEFNDIFRIGIKETARKLDVDAYRLDEELFDQGMLDKIYMEIDGADFIIADLTTKNANVFYELGYAHAKEKLCILITENAENIPFDLKHKRHIVYGKSLTFLKGQLEKNILWAKKEIDKKKNNIFEIELKTYGTLELQENYAAADLEFNIMIENKSPQTSQDIRSIFLYSTRQWKLKQERKNIIIQVGRRPTFHLQILISK